jgi:DNA-binding MarR family transcriptional regulator
MMESEKETLIQSIQERTRQFSMMPMPLPDVSTLDLTMTQFRLVMQLYQTNQMHVSQVAALFGVANATASALVERLVERGVVVRQPDPEDRRAVICSLTPAWQETVAGFWNTRQQMFDSLLQELSVEHLQAYDGLMEAIMEIMIRKSQTPDKSGAA